MAPLKSSEFKAAIYTRSTALIKARLTKLKSTIDEYSTEPLPLSQVQLKKLSAHANEIRKKKGDFDNNLQRALTLEDDPVSDDMLSADQDEIENLFSHIIATIEVLTPSPEPSSPTVFSDTASSVSHIGTAQAVRLPKLDLQKFSGEPLTWTSFINLFDTTIHRNASLNSVTKFQYLLSVLSGEPLNLVKSLNLTAPNYLVAYNLLRDRYHNERRLQSMHLNQILDLPSIHATSIKALRQFVNNFTEHTQALKALDCDITANNPLLSALLLRKMDAELRKKLESFRTPTGDETSSHTLPDVNAIIKFINTECSQTEDANIHSAPSTGTKPHPHSPASKVTMPKKVHFRSSDVAMVTTQASSAPPSSNSKSVGTQCFICNSNGHKIYTCSVFQNKSPQERYQLVKQNQRCVSCLGNHHLRDCHSQSSCRTCNKKHHTLLHFQGNVTHASHSATQNNKSPLPPAHTSNSDSNESTQTSVTYLASQGHPPSPRKSSTVLLGTLLVKLTSAQGTTHVFRALLDSGSMCDLITERAAQLLGARRHKSDIQLSGLGQSAAKNKGQTFLNIETLSGFLISPQHPMLILDNLTVDLPRVPISPEVFALTKRYCLADPTFHLPGRIDVVLGASLFSKLLTHEHYSLGPHMPHVVGTHFGYVVMGSVPCEVPTTSAPLSTNLISHMVSLHSASDVDLHSSLQRFWTQEELPTCQRKTEEEKLCDAIFTSTHTRDLEGRYIVRLPVKEAHPPLGASQPPAEHRFHSLERKFAAQPLFAQLYHDFMDEYLALDHMTECQGSPLPAPHYFLPHHGVLKESSSTTKLRTVFDASAKTSTGVSLNEILLTGPKLQANICDILTHFRTHNIVFACDIRQMYRQIRVHPDDRKFQLILWRKMPSQPLAVYQLNTVTYGLNSSPYLAIKTLHQLADDEGDSFPAAAQVLRTQTYVDDIITGADTEEAALELRDQLIGLLHRGGFELRKWVSNSDRLLQALPKGHLESPVFLQESEPHFSILGLRWSPTSDCFTYNLNFPLDPRPSKRSVLSIVAKIYDPCGFLAPATMQAKCFMQLLWTTGLSWDDPLPADLADKWHSFLTDVQHLSQVSIPRTFQFSLSHAIELHGFADASESGYAAVVYFRCQMSTGDVIIRPVMAKTRVAPLKRVTLPRLELCAAHLLAQLVSHCRSLFPDKITTQNIHLWSDSSVALTWLRTPPYRLKTYVANRVSQTQELVPLESWRHIASADNPADCASRGISASHLVDHSLWWTGPPWLKLASCDWPTPNFVPIDLSSSDETKKTPLVVLVSAPQSNWDLLSAHSSWNKLQRIIALLLRFVYNCRHRSDRLSGPLSASEISRARLKIFTLVQQSAFADEISSLRKQRDCSVRLQRLKPFIDSDGLLRVGGRLNRSALPLDARHPVLLPRKHHVVDLLVDHFHITHLHAGPQLTQALLSQSVWILCARSVIRSRIFKCVTCFRSKPRNITPLMGDLPPARITPARPFLSTGIDYCGPFTIKTFTLRSAKLVKVYLCIFVCMVTKAVHLEVVTDLTTDGFIAALTRFVSRRGLCADIYCDCGTNFVGADAVLRKLVTPHINAPQAQDAIQRYAAPRGIKFHFNPPAAPHQGGLWESAVKSAKHHLRRVMGDTILTLSEFITLSTQVEAMLNSRPLTPLSSDPADLSALTPGHFLIGTSLAAVPEPEVMEVPANRLKHWQQAQAFHQRLWQRWSLEYIHMLQQRSKWTRDSQNLKIGDLVLMHNPSSPLNWPLARITGIHPGKDGIVRVVDLRTSSGHLTRPAVKVFPLPLN